MRARLTGPVAQFAAAGVLAVIVIGAVAFWLIHRAGHDEAIRDAKRVTAMAGEGIVAPSLTPAMIDEKPRALDRLDRIVRERVLGHDGIVRVKIWNEDSWIVYSDEPRLIGNQFSLGPDELEVLRRGGVKAEETDLSAPENRYEPEGSDLVEVYLPIDSPSRERLLFETYIRSSFIASGGERIWSTLAPVLIGALVLLAVLLLPLAARLARRLQRGRREREALLQRAIDASDAERRRIAQDIHDGVVQDLAGTSYALEAASRSPGRPAENRVELAGLAEGLRDSVRDLRGLMVDIYPPDLHREGLGAAIEEVAAKLEPGGPAVAVAVPASVELPPRVESLFFRGAQEALRNAVAHADASRVSVAVARADGTARLEVADDGRGFDPAAGAAEGHFGLRGLADLAADAGGRLDVGPADGGGTRVVIEVPVS